MRGFTKLILAAALGAAALAPGAAQAWNGPWDGPRHWGPPRVYYAPPPPPVYYGQPRPYHRPPPPPEYYNRCRPRRPRCW